MASSDDEYWMTLALTQASRGIGLTMPNPPVGAVLVKNDHVIGEGYHKKAGMPHAEIEALQDAFRRGHDVKHATAYITLEPCSSHGRTPPCTDALIKAGVDRVVYGASDPNSTNCGKSEIFLAKSGVAVEGGILEEECLRLIRPFTKWVTQGLPYVIAKAGQTLDGRISRPKRESQWITSEKSREHAMSLRFRCDAILVGAETLRADNPHLTLRGGDIPEGKDQPWRVILTRSGQLPKKSHVFTDEHKDRTIILQGNYQFKDVLKELAKRGITTLLVEGGGSILGQAFHAKAVDEIFWYIAPRISGGGTPSVGGLEFPRAASSVEITDIWHESLGKDLCIHGYPVWDQQTAH